MDFIREVDPNSGIVTVRVEHLGEILGGFSGTEEQVQLAEDFFNLGYRAGAVLHEVRYLTKEEVNGL